MIQTISTQFEHELQKRTAEERDRIKEILAIGVSDWDTYQKYVGQCFILSRVADEFCDDVNTAINKR